MGGTESFRTYVSGPGGGAIELTEPARSTENGFSFAVAGGTVSGDTAEVELAGGVTFRAHNGALEVSLAELRVVLEGDEGTLYADVRSRPNSPGADPVDHPDVALGELDLSGDAALVVADDGAGPVARVTDVPVTLTADGAPAFAGFYDAGTELDPLSLELALAPSASAPVVTQHPQDLTVEEGQDAVFGAAATGTPEPSAQWQMRTDSTDEWRDVAGATGTTLVLPAVGEAEDGSEVRAVFGNGTAPDAVTAAATLTVEPAGEPGEPVWEPVVEVFAADGVTPLGEAEVTWGDSVVVRGSGFDPAGNVGGRGMPIPSDLPQGTYVVFGKFAEQWRPSQGAPSAARSVGSQRWALAREVLDQVPAGFRGAIEAQWAEVNPDGTFETTLTVAEPEGGWTVADGVLGVYTYGAGGVDNPDQELAVPLTVVDERVPLLEVSPTEDISYGTVVTVRGTGFAPDRTLSTAFTARTQTDPEFGWPVGWLHHEVVTTDALGRFTREVTISDWRTGTGDDCSEVQCWFAAFNSAQVSDNVDVDRRAERDQDVFVPVTFVAGKPDQDGEDGPTVTAEPNPVHRGGHLTVTGRDLPTGEDVTVTLEPRTQQATGHLDWGVKESFRRYVTGPVARGEVTTSDEVTRNPDGTFRFPVTEVAPDLSVLGFTGTVSFRGHEYDGTPALETHLSDLRVQLTVDSAVLLADVTSREFAGTDGSVAELTEHTAVVVATLDRAAFSTTTSQVRATGAGATLTPGGEAAFGGFYDAGEQLDPVGVEVTAGRLAPAALLLTAKAGTQVAAGEVVDGTFHAVWPVPADLPVGAYDVVVRTEAGELLADTPLTVLAQPPAVDDGEDGEDGDDEGAGDGPEQPAAARGTVTVEPDPVRRAATATFVGRDLTPGTRVGAVVDAAGEPGTLEWGVKDSFRNYITGSIAQGSVRATAPASQAADGTITFGGGSGSGDAEDATLGFSGAVAFTGHELAGSPALRVTIADPSIVIEDGVGHLVANVTSRSLDGAEDVVHPRVRLARLDLSGVGVRDGRLVGIDVPATLTADGVPAFADFYAAGEPLDPVTFSVPVGDEALDLTRLDVAEATVGEDGTVELTWQVPADASLGAHRVDLVTDGESVADGTFGVVAADAAPADGSGTTGAAASGGLARTGVESAALAALAAVVIAAGALAVTRRQRA